MADIGNEFPIQNQGVTIPGLADARRRDEARQEDNRVEENRQNQNRLEEQARAEATQNQQAQQPDRVNVAGPAQARANPGIVEQRVLRGDGELFIVPPQRIDPNPQTDAPGGSPLTQTVADLERNAARLEADTGGRGPAGNVTALQGPNDTNLSTINQEIEQGTANAQPTLDRIAQELQAGTPNPVDQQTSAQDRTVQRLVEEVVNDGRGPGLAAQAPDNPVFETPSQDVRNLTVDRAGLASTSTGRANPNDRTIRDAVRENIDAERTRQEQANAQREPERAQTERGQNVDRLI